MSSPAPLGNDPYAPPSQSPESSASALELPGVPAGFGIRLGARVIDTIAGFVFGAITGVGCGVMIAILAAARVVAPGWETRMQSFSIASLALALVGSCLYHTMSESIGGASIGKWICGLRVYAADLGPDGTPVGVRRCSIGAAAIRSAAVFVDGLFFGAVAYTNMSNSRAQQRLGDKWAGTVVLRAGSAGHAPSSPFGGVMLGLGLQMICLALGTFLQVL